MTMRHYLEQCLNGLNLSTEEAAAALDTIMTGQATDIQIAGLLVALRAKGETVDELAGFARTMRAHAVAIRVQDPDAIDLCGTGGDGKATFNVSTVASFVAAGAGVTVAKHGNRSVSSRSGSADVLGALGVNLQLTPERVEACINEIGIGFLFAPLFHPAMRYAGKARGELAVRTIFNMLGPLTNPAGVRRQLVGAFSAHAASQVALTFQRLGAKHVCVVYSQDGLDEISLAAPTNMHETIDGAPVRETRLLPETFGLPSRPTDVVRGGTAEENAAITRKILDGEAIPATEVVLANAAAAIYVAGKVASLSDGVVAAQESIASGKARAALKRLVEFTQRNAA